MITWTEFERRQPALADAGRRQLYQIGIGLAFLATVRPDGGPRVHPLCPVISDAGLHLLIAVARKRRHPPVSLPSSISGLAGSWVRRKGQRHDEPCCG